MGCLCIMINGIERLPHVDTTALKGSKCLIIFVIGGPGAGKSALGKKLAAKYGLTLVSPSDMLRSEVDSASKRGDRIERIMQEGYHVPADVIVQLVEEKMMTQPNVVGYLVVGFPRDKKQANMFNKAVRQPNLVLNLQASKSALKERMRERASAAARFDDTPVTIKKRIKKYFKTVSGAVAPNKAATTALDAEKGEDEIFASACAAVDRVKEAA